jgi:inhibitor of cysteine peptidase
LVDAWRDHQRDRSAITLTLTNQDDGGRVRVRVGDTIEIRLPETADGGYRWSVDEVDSSLFDVGELSAEYPQGPLGSSGQAVVRVTARTTGSGVVRLKYGRPWEGADGVLRHFAVEVDIQ